MEDKKKDYKSRFELDENFQREDWKRLAQQNLLATNLSYDGMLSRDEISVMTRPLRHFLLSFNLTLPMYATAETIDVRMAPKDDSKTYTGFMALLNGQLARDRDRSFHTHSADMNKSFKRDKEEERKTDLFPFNHTEFEKGPSHFLYAMRKQRLIAKKKQELKMLLRTHFAPKKR